MKPDVPLIIVNPKSGSGISERKWASYSGVIRNAFGPFECAFTRGVGDAAAIAESESRKGRTFLIAFGGDGTVSEVANGILRAGASAELGILPSGTGGDLYRTLQIPQNLAKAARKLRHARSYRLDAGKIHYLGVSGKEETRYFLNTASFGMSGHVAGRANQSTKVLGGKITYSTATIRTLFSYERPEVLLEMNGHSPLRLRILTVCIANGSSFGGGMKIAPDAKLDDGLFDVITIGNLSAAEVLKNAYKLYSGDLLTVDKVGLARTTIVRARSVEESVRIPLEVDGETPGYLPATFEILPAAISVRL